VANKNSGLAKALQITEAIYCKPLYFQDFLDWDSKRENNFNVMVLSLKNLQIRGN
jgi:hypothetical protein